MSHDDPDLVGHIPAAGEQVPLQLENPEDGGGRGYVPNASRWTPSQAEQTRRAGRGARCYPPCPARRRSSSCTRIPIRAVVGDAADGGVAWTQDGG